MRTDVAHPTSTHPGYGVRIVGLVGAVLAPVALAACTVPDNVIPNGQDLTSCQYGETPIEVEDLHRFVDCNLEGATLTFPSGDRQEVGAPGASAASEDARSAVRFGHVNLGPLGVFAFSESEETTTVWGTADARHKQLGELPEGR
jgi:hypothetical protein